MKNDIQTGDGLICKVVLVINMSGYLVDVGLESNKLARTVVSCNLPDRQNMVIYCLVVLATSSS